MGPITRLVSSAFDLARSENASLSSQWRGISWRVGIGLPQSLLMLSIQRIGALDMLLRSIEAETAAALVDSEDCHDAFDLQTSLSELWIGSVYEVLRVLKERDLTESLYGFAGIFREFTLLRIAIEKYELTTGKKITSPLRLHSIPSDDKADFVDYTGDDPMRAIIMSFGVSAHGSVVWQAVDWKNATDIWLDRLELSDRLIGMLAAPTIKGGPDQDVAGGS